MTEARDQSAKGMQALRQKDGRGAEAAFRRAIELGWPGPDVWVTLSFAKSLQGDMAGRIAALERAAFAPACIMDRRLLAQAAPRTLKPPSGKASRL